jgi:hypothetical protein
MFKVLLFMPPENGFCTFVESKKALATNEKKTFRRNEKTLVTNEKTFFCRDPKPSVRRKTLLHDPPQKDKSGVWE